VHKKLLHKKNDSTTVRLSNVERNPSLPMDQFKLSLDSSVKIIKG
jgi:outer membrane lipoprotein-sorting protein